MNTPSIDRAQFLQHKTKRTVLFRFLFICAILASYAGFVIYQYGIKDGLLATTLTWSFFVFCTPIADAGFLLDFPIRFFTNIKMLYSEIGVWIVGIGINIFAFLFQPEIYEKTELLQLFKHIIITPIPFWSIIILSMIGAFLSVYFGDELVDTVKHAHRTKHKKHKKKQFSLFLIFGIVVIVLLYIYLLEKTSIQISIF